MDLFRSTNRETDIRTRRADPRPLEGPISIEHLPPMLAARNVKRYPYSQKDDPAVMYS